MASDKTEKPTGKRLEDLRKKGQIPQSRDLSQAASFFAAVMVLGWMGGRMTDMLTAVMQESLARVGQKPLAVIESTELAGLAARSFYQVTLVSGPLALSGVIAVVAAQAMAQRGIRFTPEAIRLNFAALNPAAGLKRLGLQGGYELLKATIVSIALVTIGWQTIHPLSMAASGLSRMSVLHAVGAGWQTAMSMCWKVAILLVVTGVSDYGYQYFRFMRANRMTKQEVKDEQRNVEGNPEIKGRIKRMQLSLFRRRMMAAVPKATVVITNPTHYAMALEYRRGEMAAPKVVAKGKNLIAQRIKQLAREHGVPIVENKPLAQALYKSAAVGDVIPGALFDAVAEVLAYLIRLKQLVL